MFATIGPDDSRRRAQIARAHRTPASPLHPHAVPPRAGTAGRPAIFLDRDDTLCRCDNLAPGNDLGDPDLVELLPGAAEACRALADAGYALVVMTNQGGVARGRYGTEDVERTCQRLNDLLGGLLAAAYYCPYHPTGTVAGWAREHPWRKPQPGMLLAAAEDLGLDLSRSWAIGDKPRDCVAGLAAGARAILLTHTIPGAPPSDDGSLDERTLRAPDLPAAAALVLRAPGRERDGQNA
jgi:histidinol-phosphate phosphatase family protein